MTNTRAEALLDKQGITYEREPDWVKKGQKPDFYCCGRSTFWCEVKTLGRLPDDEDQNRALAELRNRTSNISSPGYGIAYIRSALSPRDAKAVTNLLKRAVPRLEASDAPQVAVAIIPGDATLLHVLGDGVKKKKQREELVSEGKFDELDFLRQ